MKYFLAKAEWLNPPIRHHFDGNHLLVEAAEQSDFWQETHYGFRRDSGHALLAPAPPTGSFEISFDAAFDRLYDQAGLLLRNSETDWIKAGAEVNDGILHAAAVVTKGQSDWSLSPRPEWARQTVTIRASWRDGAVTIRTRSRQSAWNTLRLAPMEIRPSTKVGLYVCSPERAGLRVRFSRAIYGAVDAELHVEP